jgi:hypothetical protein
MYGLMREYVGDRNYGLTGGYLRGRVPFTLDDAPSYHQDDLDDLPWPGGLVGGMISANGNAPSFRGKAYTEYVEAVTGHSLYAACSELWEGERLAEITEALEVVEHRHIRAHRLDRDEAVALARWFRVCVDHDLAVGGDY